MQTIQVGELKTNFSNILKQVHNSGETFIMEYGKKHKKVAMLVPYKEKKRKRVFGIYKGKYHISNDFNKEDDDINRLFYGGTIEP